AHDQAEGESPVLRGQAGEPGKIEGEVGFSGETVAFARGGLELEMAAGPEVGLLRGKRCLVVDGAGAAEDVGVAIGDDLPGGERRGDESGEEGETETGEE